MVDQDGLVQVGSELTLEVPVAQDITIPVGSAPDHFGSAPLSAPPFDMSQMMEMLMERMDANVQRMESRMDANVQTLRGEMQSMGISLQEQMKAGQEEMKAELAKVKGEMQTMNWRMATARGEMTESRGSVKGVRTAMTTGEVEATSDVTRDHAARGPGEKGTAHMVDGSEADV